MFIFYVLRPTFELDKCICSSRSFNGSINFNYNYDHINNFRSSAQVREVMRKLKMLLIDINIKFTNAIGKSPWFIIILFW